MQSSWRYGMVLGVVAGLVMAAAAADKTADNQAPVLAKQRYDAVMAHLDSGGDLLVVANMEGWLKDAVSSIIKPVTALGGDDPDFLPAVTFLRKLPGFLDKSGFYGFQGFGMSIVPRTDGLNTIKCFVARSPEAAHDALWTAMVGGEPRKLAGADFLPADTELARTGTEEFGALWSMIRSGVADLGSPAAAAAFNTQLQVMSTNVGINLDQVFASLGGEGFLAIPLSRTETISLPCKAGDTPVTMPRPAFLIGVAIKDDTLVRSLEAAIAKSGMLSVSNGADGIKIINSPFPVPPYLPLQPAYTTHAGFFLFGSTPAVLADGIKAYETKSGLAATPAFKKAFEGLPMVNNGISYMSPRFMNTILDVQRALIAREPGEGAKMAAMMDNMMGCKRNMTASQVYLNQRDGVAITGVSSAGARETVGSLMMAPVGMMAAIAIPSFMKARTTSQQNACVNNLRMLEAAKEQWALENKKENGSVIHEADIIKYLGLGKMPVCPQGGRYILNPVGSNARCSCPGHQLND